MSIDQALRKSDESGRESARNAIKTIAFTIGGAIVILLILDRLGADIAVWELARELVMSRIGMTGAAVTTTAILFAYADGFGEMLQKFLNTGKLGSAGTIGVLTGVAPAVVYLLAPSISIPLWLVLGGLLLSLGSAVFYGQQQERLEQNS